MLTRWLFSDDAAVLGETNFKLLLVSTMFPILGTSLVSPVLDSMIEPLGTSPASIGLVMSFYTAPAVVMIPIGGVLADRYGRKPVIVGSLLLFGAGGVAIPLTTDFRVVLGLRLVQGIGFAGLLPTITTAIGDMYSGAREATSQGLRAMVGGLSGAVVPAIGGVLVVLAWQYPFYLYGLAFVAAAAVMIWFEEPSGIHTGRDDLPTGISYWRALYRCAKRRGVVAFLVARSLQIVVWIAFVTYNSLIVVRLLGESPALAGALVGVLSLVFGLTASQAGRVTAAFPSKIRPLVGANVLYGGGLALVVLAPGIGFALIGVTLSGVGMGIVLSLYRSVITGAAPEELRGGLVSLSAAGARLLATLTPVLMGVAIGIATSTMGFPAALRTVTLGAAVLGGGGGVACILLSGGVPTTPEQVGSASPDRASE